MTDYITVPQFKARHGITVTDKDDRIAAHIAAASGKVDAFCHRTFGPHSGAATVRYFKPLDCFSVWIDDAYEITAVAVDGNDDGTYSTAVVAADYETDPPNGIGPDGQSGWPVSTVRLIDSTFPTTNRRRAVKVTAKWGWSAVPDTVVEACYLFTNRLMFEVAVPGGVFVPNIDMGLPGSPLQRPYTAEGLLAPFTRYTIAVA